MGTAQPAEKMNAVKINQIQFERMFSSLVFEHMSRSNIIKAIRPEIGKISNTELTTEVELFQNNVLRPILKFQNDIIKAIFVLNLKKQTIDFYKMNHQGKIDFITQQIQKDLGLRNMLIGLVLGLMAEEDVTQYYMYETEYRRRITKMTIDRLADQLG
jgi:TctA family transporter